MNIAPLLFCIINSLTSMCVGAVTVYTGWPIVCKPFEECHPVLRKRIRVIAYIRRVPMRRNRYFKEAISDSYNLIWFYYRAIRLKFLSLGTYFKFTKFRPLWNKQSSNFKPTKVHSLCKQFCTPILFL